MSDEVLLVQATEADSMLLSNLLELYTHDLSAVFPAVELRDDGRYGYPKLPLYWSEPKRRFAFLVRVADRTAGFALVTRGSPASADPDVFDLAEFFILRRYRRSGAGRAAVQQLLRALPGSWTVRVSERNIDALPFWARVMRDSGRNVVESRLHPDTADAWRVYSFDH
jgi:predicted acetyltransferase